MNFPETGDAEPLLVIEGMLTDRTEVQYIRVSYTAPIADSTSSIPVKNAVVKLVSAAGDTVNYEYTTDGWYVSPVFGALHGMNFTLQVTFDEILYQYSGQIPDMNGLDSVYYDYFPESADDDSAYYVYINAGMVEPEKVHYYQINALRNNKGITRGEDIWIFDDKYIKQANGIKLPPAFKENDTVVIELCSLSKEMFDYYLMLGNELFATAISNIGYRANPPAMFQPAALGYFQFSAVNRKEVIIQKFR